MPTKEEEARIGDEEEEEVVEDMITLKNLTEQALLENIQKRFDSKFIYTYVGTILISVNPYQILPIYRAEDIQRYAGAAMGSLPPHVFAIGDDTYRAMTEAGNQSILISGESGSGKTEATKLIMQYLASITSKHSRVEQQILDTNPILEAFGNAKTVRNNNSSRFGKYIKIHFDAQGHISGARIQEYLLEKSRIVYQSAGERNYHSFYQLCSGASEEEKAELHLQGPEHFHYVNQGSTTVDGMDDAAEYQASRKALDVLGIPKNEQDAIFRILAGILHLGNVSFGYPANEDGVEDEERSEVKTKEAVEYAAELLEVDCESLKAGLTTRNIKSGLETVTANLKVHQATDARDALAKAIYSTLFEWLVNRINECIGADSSQRYIGILDIFGFENFKHNLFEQFCINYANEKLHQHFNQYIFKLEQQVYDSEGINWSKIEFKDNEECVDLIERKSSGMLAMLDEECRVPRGSDEGYVEKMHQKHSKNTYYCKPRIPNPIRFGVRHYAGEVTYDASNCLDKNRDTLYQGLSDLMKSSSLELLSRLFEPPKSVSMDDDEGNRRRSRSMGGLRQLTVGAKFKNQLRELMETMSATQPHYIRCIKPNPNKKPIEFDHDLVETQLRYSGMLDTIRVRRSGYPVRYDFERFWKRYRLISASVKANEKDMRESITQVLELARGKLEELGVIGDDFQVGKSKVFFRDNVFGALEILRNKVMAKSCLVIQKVFRGYREKKRYKQMKASSVKIQARVRCYQARQRFLELKQSSITAQRVYRGWIRARYYRRLKKAAIWSAKNCRRGIARRKYLLQRNAAIIVQCRVRGFFPRRRFRMMRRAIVPIQQQTRMWLCWLRYIRMRIASRRIQIYYRKFRGARFIQTMIRGFVPRVKYRRMRVSAIKMQAMLRASHPRKSYNKMKKAAKKVSRIVHRWLWAKHYAERCEAASLNIQKNTRKFLAYRKYRTLKTTAIVCQKWRRRAVARRSYINQRTVSILIQKWIRMKFERRRYLKLKSAAVRVQAFWKCQYGRCRFKALRKGTISVQSLYRMRRARSEFMVIAKSVLLIQSVLRGHKERASYWKKLSAVCVIQAAIRRNLLKKNNTKILIEIGMHRKLASMEFGEVHKRVSLIQSHMRGFLMRKSYKSSKNACISIQRWYRTKLARMIFKVQRQKATEIQRIVRGYWGKKEKRKRMLAVCSLQNICRIWKERKKYIIMRDAIRKEKAESEHLRQCAKSAIKLQSVVRRHLKHKKWVRMKFSSVKIQRVVRGYRARKQRKKFIKAVLRLQACYRKLGDRKFYVKLRGGICRVQAMVKGRMARRQYKRLVQSRPTSEGQTDTIQEDFTKYSWQGFAQGTFQSHYSGLRAKRRQTPIKELISFTRDSITTSLLPLSKEDEIIAIECFLNIQRYMGDAFAKRNPMRWAKDVAEEGINRESIRSEIYCQLCRQLTDNPSESSLVRGWELACIFTGLFPPVDKDIINPLRGFIQRHEKKSTASEMGEQCKETVQLLAREAHKRLSRTSTMGARKTIPTPVEIVSTCRREPMILQVRPLDSTTEPYEVFIDSTTTVSEVLSRVSRDAGLGSRKWGFKLFSRAGVKSGYKKLDEDCYIIDYVYQGIRIPTSQYAVGEKKGSSGEFAVLTGGATIAFSKRLFLRAEIDALKESKTIPATTLSLMYTYILRSVTSSQHVCGATVEDVVSLSALQLQSVFSDASADREKSFDMKKHVTIPSVMVQYKEEKEWRSSIVEKWRKLKSTSRSDAILQHIVESSELPLYGHFVFPAVLIFSELRETHIPPQCYISVSEIGICFYPRTAQSLVEEPQDFSVKRFDSESRAAGFGFAGLESWSIRQADAEDLKGDDSDSESDEDVADAAEGGDHLPDQLISFKIKENPSIPRAHACRVDILVQSKAVADAESSIDLLEEYKSILTESASQAVAREDHLVSDGLLLSFRKGMVIDIIAKDDVSGWYEGETDGQTGFFPKSMVDLVLSAEQLEASETMTRTRSIAMPTRRSKSEGLIMARGRGMTLLPFKPEEEKTADDDKSLLSLAKKYFRESENGEDDSGGFGGFFKKASSLLGISDPEESTKFTSEPIKHSLFKLKKGHENLDSIAVACFCDIMRYMGDYPMDKRSTDAFTDTLSVPDSLSQSIVQRALDNPSLYSEIIFQICRQCRNNSRKESIVKGWELLAICLGCFAPAADFVSYFRAGFLYCEDRAKKKNHFGVSDAEAWAELVVLRLRRTTWNGPRSRVPSTLELAASRERRQVVQRVWLPDGTTRALLVDPASTARESLQGLSKTLGLRNSGGYTLYTASEGKMTGGQSLRDSDHLLDFVSEYERVVLARGERSGVSNFGFLFKRKLFLPQFDDMSNTSAVSLQYHQLQQDVLNGLFPCTEHDTLVFAAHQLTADVLEDGASRKDEKRYQKALREKITKNVPEYIPTVSLTKKPQGEWIELILKTATEVKSSSGFLAQLMYIKHARNWELYGSTIFSVQVEHAEEIFDDVLGEGESKLGWLAVNRKGIAVLEEGGKEPAEQWGYDQVLQYVHFADNWVLATGSLMDSEKHTFITEEASEISELVECYFELYQDENRKKEQEERIASGVVDSIDFNAVTVRAGRTRGKSIHLRGFH